MDVKWIVTDMDGTLLNSRDEITDRTREALMACQKKGIRLILASGRSYVRQLPYAEELKLKEYGGCLIENNGLTVNDLSPGGRHKLTALGRKDMELLFPVLQKWEVEIQGYEDDAIYYWIPDWQRPIKEKERQEKGYPKEHPLVAGAWSWVTDNIHNYPRQIEIHSMDELPEKINKLNATDREERILELYEMLTETYAGQYEFVRTGPRLIEISPRGITKGQTLKRMMDRAGIKPEEVMAFGDGENDVDMFRVIKYGIAMGNAAEYVKAHAFAVTETNGKDGIAAALERYGVI
ncbi:HAD family hydrolase [Candidatus Merdisoma sp. HCP28S3_D10]|uniref:HAD family hydrolase n=1 Tax=unclassified Candidatus Merdisoma TaxID=3099611 RepID=UPI003F8C3EFC